MLQVDADHIEQALINLVRNAADAALSPDATDGGAAHVEISWQTDRREVVIAVLDNGPGLTNAGNLFVPFYTTKPGGPGSVLCSRSRLRRRIEDRCSWQTERMAMLDAERI